MSATLLVGLTGGIGSGKSTVARTLSGMGAEVVDADAIAREVTAAGGAAIPAIRTAFGASFITDDGALDRTRMRDHAFRHAEAKQRLEAIVHPLVGLITRERIEGAVRQRCPCVVLDIPLLVESGHWREALHRVIVVDCDEKTQIERVVARSGLAHDDVARIIASQASRRKRLAAADIVLYNQSKSFEALDREVSTLADPFGLSLAHRK